ncbi:cysteine desulfurase family protein [Clostridium cylindrosporum]|uniref:Cysteine desulfurase IscS n=1 Tax=Clostridium cylindrosporum DSM 605 TaxID=1121307 RepID=A0A0J8D3Y0_CLOCY|nr:cysteine desulfurase family protein [Clostridium cylindrosporum]KMT20880.1 cysteine desulfurase IscS [Clostridium cylindrosporum DSM 605]
MNIVYFDNSATTKPHKEVIAEVVDCLENFYGNPSSAYKLGIEAEKKIKIARERVAKLIGAAAQEIIFTSGGSESNNTAVKGLVKKGDHVIISSVEHKSMLQTVREMESEGIEVTLLPINNYGIIDIEVLEGSIKGNTKLVSVMHVNNEIGSIQPIKEISKVVREKSKKAKIHVDAVQSLGKIPIDVKNMDIDLMSLSAHKIHGPKGVGALYIKKGLVIKPLISGGGQEIDQRSGTENVPGISGFGVAALLTYDKFDEKFAKVRDLKERFINSLSDIDDIIINSPIDENHVNNILNVSFGGIRGEVLLHSLEDYNIFVSTGSACSAKKASDRNYVLPALGISDFYIKGTIRFSFSYINTIDEIDYTIDAIKKVLPFLRRIK